MSSNRIKKMKDELDKLGQAHSALEQDLKKHRGDAHTPEVVLESYQTMIHQLEKKMIVQLKAMLDMERAQRTKALQK
jgi:hypothetical protein